MTTDLLVGQVISVGMNGKTEIGSQKISKKRIIDDRR